MLAAVWDVVLRIWDTQTGRQQFELRAAESIHAIGFSPDGRRLAAGLHSGDIAFLDPATGKWQQTVRGGADSETVNCVRFSPDGKLLASAGDNRSIQLWDAITYQPLRTLVGHREPYVLWLFRRTAEPWPAPVRMAPFGYGVSRPAGNLCC